MVSWTSHSFLLQKCKCLLSTCHQNADHMCQPLAHVCWLQVQGRPGACWMRPLPSKPLPNNTCS
jgi:hypothetical protein